MDTFRDEKDRDKGKRTGRIPENSRFVNLILSSIGDGVFRQLRAVLLHQLEVPCRDLGYQLGRLPQAVIHAQMSMAGFSRPFSFSSVNGGSGA